jgi:hypothetical protein
VRSSRGSSGLRAEDAVSSVVVEQAERDLLEAALNRTDLRDYVDAVAVVFDHARWKERSSRPC